MDYISPLHSQRTKEDMLSQLNNLKNDMFTTMLPNLHTLANVCITLPLGTASVGRSFIQMKMIKTQLRNRLGEKSLSYLMKIAIESPQKIRFINDRIYRNMD